MARLRAKPKATPDDLAFGIHACERALGEGLAKRLLHAEGASNRRVAALVDEAAAQGLPVEAVEAERLAELTGGGVHQGVLVRLHRLPATPLPRKVTGPSLAIVLDGVTDPQNTGAVLRVAVATGAEAVVLPPRRGAALTPGVHRASAGLSFLAPVAAPQNLARALSQLKEAGYWVVAASPGEGAENATAFDWPDCTALVLGGEERGVSRLLNEASDFRVALPMDGRVESLNVGVACGALAYLWRARWPG
ncbi:MAG: 23S rRNA (guanosine(2251)-2'-O)-methyltransferase RlmB [Dehalococcoidia bacterium]|nr:23S rRNA (guanosine(2251)-2'-O)-methyltransferase RlmB [Dehalococcoidia bacterium]